MDGDESGDTLDAPTTVVTLECAALLPGSEAQEVVDHIEQVWNRGKLAVDYLREQLGPELRDGCVVSAAQWRHEFAQDIRDYARYVQLC